jgi:hypothetical protein
MLAEEEETLNFHYTNMVSGVFLAAENCHFWCDSGEVTDRLTFHRIRNLEFIQSTSLIDICCCYSLHLAKLHLDLLQNCFKACFQ